MLWLFFGGQTELAFHVVLATAGATMKKMKTTDTRKTDNNFFIELLLFFMFVRP